MRYIFHFLPNRYSCRTFDSVIVFVLFSWRWGLHHAIYAVTGHRLYWFHPRFHCRSITVSLLRQPYATQSVCGRISVVGVVIAICLHLSKLCRHFQYVYVVNVYCWVYIHTDMCVLRKQNKCVILVCMCLCVCVRSQRSLKGS